MAGFVIVNARLLDLEAGVLRGGASLRTEGDKIVEVAEGGREIAAGDDVQVLDARGRTLMPGLIDAHVHAALTTMDFAALARRQTSWRAIETKFILEGMLARGFTTVRDAGGAGIGLKRAVAEGVVPGPRLFVSGHALSQTGGHGDTRARADFLRPVGGCGCFRAGALSRVVDGVDGVRRAVREELQMGADQIKIMASGGIASPTDPIAAWGYADDEIRAIVHEANARQTYVMAHAYTAEAIERVVRLGVRTIEHGNLVDDRVAAMMAAQGAYMVPTLVTYEALAAEGAAFGLPAESAAKIASVRSAGLRALETCRRAGVRIGFGTDLLGASQRLQCDEFRIRAEVQPPLEVLRSATVIAAEVLNMGGSLGRLVPGAQADALVLEGNPLRDLSCLWDSERGGPALVMKAGAIHHEHLA